MFLFLRRCAIGFVLAAILLIAGELTAQTQPASGTTSAAEEKELNAAALKLTKEAAAKYEFTVESADGKAAQLRGEPILQWTNPSAGQIYGNVFLWTSGGRPAVVGSLFKWFSPHTHMSHEFQSLTEQPLRGSYEGKEVWNSREPGVRFMPLAGAGAPAAGARQRLVQMRELVAAFVATKRERDDSVSELRLLTQPIFRYEAPQAGVIDGALFAFVQGTDPELFLLLEARESGAKSTWQFAACRMNSVGLSLRQHDQEIWKADVLPWADVYGHRQAYTSFRYEMP